MTEETNKIWRTQQVFFPLYKLFSKVTFLKAVRIGNRNKYENVLIISNHISYLDAFLVIGHFSIQEFRTLSPVRTIMSNQFLYYHPFSIILKKLGCYPARPKKDRLHGLKASINYAANQSLFFFPEGGIKGKKNATRLRTGAAVIANKTGIKVLPVYIHRNRVSYTVVRGKLFDAKGMDIHEMMNKVYELEGHIKK